MSAAAARASRISRCAAFGGVRVRGLDHLQRDLAIEARVFGQPDHAHAARAELADNLIRPDRLAPACTRDPTELRQVGLRRRFVLQRHDLVGIDADHDVGDLIVDLREQVAGACRNDDRVAGLQLMRHAVADRRGVAAGPVQQPDVLVGRRPRLRVDEIGPGDERRRSGNDVVHLAHVIVLGHRIRLRLRRACVRCTMPTATPLLPMSTDRTC